MLAQATREYDMQRGMQNTAAPQPPVTINDRIVNSLSLAQEVLQRLEVLNRALRGSIPQDAMTKAPKEAETSLRVVAASLHDVLLNINSELTNAYQALGV